MTGGLPETLHEPAGGPRPAPVRGLLLLFSGGQPCCVVLPLDAPLVLGREALQRSGLADERLSRRHAQLTPAGGGVLVEDLGSTNGTFVDGARVAGGEAVPAQDGAVLRLGQTVGLLVPEVAALSTARLPDALGRAVGRALAPVLAQAEALGRDEATLCVLGPPGSGRGLVAEAFASAGGGTVTRASVDEALPPFSATTSLLLEDVDRWSRQRLEELASALEASAPRRLACTTATDLVALARQGRVPEALSDRLARPCLRAPPLERRLEELPLHLVRVVAAEGLAVDAALVEATLRRPWAGGLHALRQAGRAAAALARQQGHTAVREFSAELEANPAPAEAASAGPRARAGATAAAAALGLSRKTALKLLPAERWAALFPTDSPATREAAREAGAAALRGLLEQHGFQQAATARALDISRTTLLKLLQRLGLPRAAAISDEALLATLASHAGDLAAAADALDLSVEALRQRISQRPRVSKVNTGEGDQLNTRK